MCGMKRVAAGNDKDSYVTCRWVQSLSCIANIPTTAHQLNAQNVPAFVMFVAITIYLIIVSRWWIEWKSPKFSVHENGNLWSNLLTFQSKTYFVIQPMKWDSTTASAFAGSQTVSTWACYQNQRICFSIYTMWFAACRPMAKNRFQLMIFQPFELNGTEHFADSNMSFIVILTEAVTRRIDLITNNQVLS